MRIRFCHSCGARNESEGSYCLACGVRFLLPDEVAGSHETRDEPVDPERALGSSGEGVTELPVADWDQADEAYGASPPAPASQRGFRSLLIIIVVVAILLLGLSTLRSRDADQTEQTEQTEPSTTTTAATDDSALRSYTGEISVLAEDVAELRATGRRINDEWDNRVIDYDTTLDRTAALVSRAGVLPDRLGALTVPERADQGIHQRMIESLSTLASAAEGMMAGLESTDSGETRLVQLRRFEAAASEFGSLAVQVDSFL